MEIEQFYSAIKSYQKKVKDTKIETPLTKEELSLVSSFAQNIPDKYKEGFERVQRGDYSQFEKMPIFLRNYFGALEVENFYKRFSSNVSLDNKDVCAYLRENAMKPDFRAGISAAKNSSSPKDAAFASAADSYMSRYLMTKTMLPPTEQEVKALEETVGAEEAERERTQNYQRQLIMAKTLFLAQVGKYEVGNKYGIRGQLTDPVYETLVHGSRTNFILGNDEETKLVFDAYLGKDMGKEAGVTKRMAATHTVTPRTFDQNQKITSETKESKTYLRAFSNQYGMNVAVGGLGTKGVNGKVISGDGTAGHVYMRLEKGDEKHCGSILFGIEGAEPGKDTLVGHRHNLLGKGAKQTPFLSDKGVIGEKVGGRQVDLSGIHSVALARLLSEFSTHYSKLQQAPNTPQNREKLERVNNMLMGKPMEREQFTDLFSDLEIEAQDLINTISQARKGYVANLKTNNISKEQFQQSVRASFSQKAACGLAEARFNAAGKDHRLAVGAVKELMFTHETRGRAWRFFHPIQNRREKAKIANLTKRLTTEKNMSLNEIASQMKSAEDSFSMNWGGTLSNDPGMVDFVNSNEKSFLVEESKLAAVTQKAISKLEEKAGQKSPEEKSESQQEITHDAQQKTAEEKMETVLNELPSQSANDHAEREQIEIEEVKEKSVFNTEKISKTRNVPQKSNKMVL